MGDEHGSKVLTPRHACEEPSAPAGSSLRGRPARASEENADGSGAVFPTQSKRKLDSLMKKSLIEEI
jgi:hypothetical protein